MTPGVTGRTYGDCFAPFGGAEWRAGDVRIYFAPLLWASRYRVPVVGDRVTLRVEMPASSSAVVVVDQWGWASQSRDDFRSEVVSARTAARQAWVSAQRRRAVLTGRAWVCVVGSPEPTGDLIVVDADWRVCCCFV